MSPELDVPLTPSADQIRRREFVTVRRGYDPDQVRQYLMRVAEQVEALEELARNRPAAGFTPAGAPSPAPEPQPTPGTPGSEPSAPDLYSAASVYMADLLRTAEATAKRIEGDAEYERDRKLTEAGAEADHIRTDAQARAEAIRQEADMFARNAKAEADRLLSGLDGRREALVGELNEMRDHLLTMAHSLGALAAEHEAGSEPESSSEVADPGPDPRYIELWASEEGEAAASGTDVPEVHPSGADIPGASAPEARAWTPDVVEVPEVAPARSADPLEQLFADIPTLSLDDLDPGEFDR